MGILSGIGSIIGAWGSKKANKEANEIALMGLKEQKAWNLHAQEMDKQNFELQSSMFEKNFGLQQEQYEYQKGLQQEIFGREDTAVQRRTADLKAAGINPVLAAGSAANAGQAVATNAPQQAVPQRSKTDKPLDVNSAVLAKQAQAQHRLQLMSQMTQLEHSIQQNRLIRQQRENMKAEKQLTEARTREVSLDTDISEYDYELAKEAGVRTDLTGGFQAQLQQLYYSLKNPERLNMVIDRGLEVVQRVLGNIKDRVFDPLTSTQFESVNRFFERLEDKLFNNEPEQARSMLGTYLDTTMEQGREYLERRFSEPRTQERRDGSSRGTY